VQATVLIIHYINVKSNEGKLGYLMYNVIGSSVVILIAFIIQYTTDPPKSEKEIEILDDL